MILVAGGSGRLGTLVVKRLADLGFEVRVVTRDPSRARHLGDAATDLVEGDVRNRASLEQAVDGVSVVVSAVHGFAGPGRVTPASVDRDGNANLVDAAARAGADVVLMSVVGAAEDHPMELFRAKHAAEMHLRASSARWTIVRATAFVELWADIMRRPIVLGRGTNPINFVSVHDVADAVVRAVVDPSLRGQILEIGGPQNMTFNDLATFLATVRGRPAHVRHVPRSLLRAVAPFSRQASAAIAMDTMDMTFDAAAARGSFVDLPMTDMRSALGLARAVPGPGVEPAQ